MPAASCSPTSFFALLKTYLCKLILFDLLIRMLWLKILVAGSFRERNVFSRIYSAVVGLSKMLTDLFSHF